MAGAALGPRSIEEVLRRDRAIVVSALAAVTLLCWVYLVVAAGQMETTGSTGTMALVQVHSWTPVDVALLLAMWVVMMIGMMIPSATPMILLYAQVARKAERENRPLSPTGLFVFGYVVVWTLFSVAATATQWGLDELALLSPMMVATSPALGAGLLIAAGLYQMTPWKDACLRHCRAPAEFLSSHWRRGRAGALRMGFEHGAYCLGCCWVLMTLLFVGGVMNLLWIGAITLFVLLEKAAPMGQAAARFSGVALIATGVAVMAGWTW